MTQKRFFTHALIKSPPLHPILNGKAKKLPSTHNPLSFGYTKKTQFIPGDMDLSWPL